MTVESAQHQLHQDRWNSLRLPALVVGGIDIVALIVLAFFDPHAAAEGWLVGTIFWWSISVGALAILGLHHLTGGAWAAAIRTELRSAAVCLLVTAVAFIPLLIAPGAVYEWATAEGSAELPPQRAAWLLPWWFRLRAVIYFVCWGGFAILLMSRRLHPAASRFEYRRPMRAAFGLIVLVFATSLAAVDWLMSLDSHWYSTGFGLYILAGCALSGYALSLAAIGIDPVGAALLLSEPRQLRRDQGNFLLVLVIFWAYIAFTQYLIIWSGDLEEDISWFLARTSGVWKYVGIGLIVMHFAVPFLVLLSDQIKESPRALGWVAFGVLGLHLIETLWIIAPSLPRHEEMAVQWQDVVGVLAVGGLWLGAFAWQMGSAPRFEPQVAPQSEPAWEASKS